VLRALDDVTLTELLAHPVHVVAVGKAASAMATALSEHPRVRTTTLIAIGTHRAARMPAHIEWYEASHPIPDRRSVAAAQRALDVAGEVARDECLVLLLSGGASALMAMPVDGLTLEEKQQTIQQMMLAGADIWELNTVRKHLSRIKGGRLAAACRGTTLTLAVSDVVGDDLAVIGSGPGVADPTTWRDAARVLSRFGPPSATVRRLIERGIAGELADTPKPHDPIVARARARVIASRRDALQAARVEAEARGYHVVSLSQPVTGEARDVAAQWFASATHASAALPTPLCVLSAGETTVHVTGGGRGGRNQEFVLSLIDHVAAATGDTIIASVGSDGIDGPTDAAGALVDCTTRARAVALGLSAKEALDDNNAYDFFATLGDLIHLGRTDTNVGDLQVLLCATR
jgi:hydroxypyruvate reductase